MGSNESKEEKNIRALLNCNVKAQIKCPICNQILGRKITYNQLNMHLRQCGNIINSKLNKENQTERVMRNKIHKNLNIDYEDMVDKKYLNANKNNLINSQIRIKSKKSRSFSDDQGTINDFQLVIDYNNTKNHDLYEEKLKNEGKKAALYDKYSQLRKFLINKKNLMNFDVNIECNSNKELFNAIKNCNIYNNTKFILSKNSHPDSNQTGKIKKPKILSLNLAINKYIDIMIKNNVFYVIDNTFFFQFNTEKVDYEMIGIILSILFIYPEIKLRYYVPLFLCKILVNQSLELSDIQNINNKLYKELSDLSKDKNINEKGLVYFYEGNELLIDGKNIKVDNHNVYDYIEKIINYENGKNKEKSKIIKSNLFNLIPKKYIFSFNGEELYRIVNRNL
jgi:hypothetical protein